MEEKFLYLFVNILPHLSARKAYLGRQHVIEGFIKYFTSEGHEQSSELVRARYDAGSRNHASLEDIAKFEISGLFGILINTVPCTFWFLLEIVSNPILLRDLQAEISSIAVPPPDQTLLHEKVIQYLDISKLRQNCPLLNSAFQEMLRTRSTGSSIRLIREDCLLDNKYLLKKGSVIQMPFSVIHGNKNLCGPSVGTLDPGRFLKQGPKTVHHGKTASRGFGEELLCVQVVTLLRQR